MVVEKRLITRADLNEMTDLIERWNCGNCRFMKRFKPKLFPIFWMSEIEELCTDSESIAFIYRKNTSIEGFILLAPLTWESRIFEKKMGVVKFVVYDPNNPDAMIIAQELISAVVTYAKEQQFNFLSCKVYSNDNKVIHALQAMKFLLVDAMLDFIYDFQKIPYLNQADKHAAHINYEVRSADSLDLDSTLSMVKKSFRQHFGRFHSDPRIPKEKSDKVYCEWINSSFGGYADFIVVAVMEKEVIGCSLWKMESALEAKHQLSIAHYSLGCVHPDHSGKGVFQQITNRGMEYFANQSIRFIEGPTHINNHPVHSAYQRLNWSIMDARYAFHLWL